MIDLFGILVFVNAIVINRAMLENIYIIQILSAEKS